MSKADSLTKKVFDVIVVYGTRANPLTASDVADAIEGTDRKHVQSILSACIVKWPHHHRVKVPAKPGAPTSYSTEAAYFYDDTCKNILYGEERLTTPGNRTAKPRQGWTQTPQQSPAPWAPDAPEEPNPQDEPILQPEDMDEIAAETDRDAFLMAIRMVNSYLDANPEAFVILQGERVLAKRRIVREEDF